MLMLNEIFIRNILFPFSKPKLFLKFDFFLNIARKYVGNYFLYCDTMKKSYNNRRHDHFNIIT